MIPPLRKRHVGMWIILVPILLLGMIAAYQAVPLTQSDTLYREQQQPALAETLAFTDIPAYKASIRASSDSIPAYQLEMVLKQALMHPSTMVFLADDASTTTIEQMQLLGSLGPQGVYRMSLPAENRAVWHFAMFDAIKQSVYERIEVIK